VYQTTLIDPDSVELHNLGEMSFLTTGDIGQNKAEVIVQRMRQLLTPEQTMRAVTASITQRSAVDALTACDVVFSCVDHDMARVAITVFTTLWGIPLIDIATGIFDSGPTRRLGADVRLTIPGQRCLMCLGGVSQPDLARRALSSAENETRMYGERVWNLERAGSLRSLNQLAAATAARLWEDFMAERIQQSSWCRIEFDPFGKMHVSEPTFDGRRNCRLCQRAGTGDRGLPEVRLWLREGMDVDL
jgi:hypothetical protein